VSQAITVLKAEMCGVLHSIARSARREYDVHFYWGIWFFTSKRVMFQGVGYGENILTIIKIKFVTLKRQSTNSSFIMLYLIQKGLH